MGFGIGALAVWRVTHLLHAEDGPGEVFLRLRDAAGDGFFGRLLGCFYCLSLWVALPVAPWLAAGWVDRGLTWLALSAAAILLHRLVPPPAAAWVEDPPAPGAPDVLLRTPPPGPPDAPGPR